MPPILPPQDGFLFLDRDKFHDSFAADLPARAAAFMADSQVPWGVDALGGTVTEPAWRRKPSWYLVATDDRMIPPPAQRAMAERAGATVVEATASHAVYVSQPAAVAAPHPPGRRLITGPVREETDGKDPAKGASPAGPPGPCPAPLRGAGRQRDARSSAPGTLPVASAIRFQVLIVRIRARSWASSCSSKCRGGPVVDRRRGRRRRPPA